MTEAEIIEKEFLGQLIKIDIVNGEDLYSLEEIGKMLGYNDEHEKRAYVLFSRNKDELEQYSTSFNMKLNGDTMKRIRLNRKGVWRMSMFSKTEIGKKVRDFLTDIANELDQKGAIIPQFTDPIDKELFILEELRKVLLREKEMRLQLADTQQDVFLLKQEFQEYMPMNDTQRKIIRDGVKRVNEMLGIWIWKDLHDKCGFSKLETTPAYKFGCIMRIVNDYLNQTTLSEWK